MKERQKDDIKCIKREKKEGKKEGRRKSVHVGKKEGRKGMTARRK